MTGLLELDAVSKAFGGNQALDSVSLVVPEGGLIGLIGPNGSGKTTLINLISGLHHPDTGHVIFDGVVFDGTPPERRARLGIGRTFQLSRLFIEMSVQDNLVAAAAEGPGEAARARAGELLELVGLSRMSHHKAGELSYGQGRLLELARVLMLEPRLILLDEPAAGIHPRIIERLQNLILDLNRERRTTFVIVEHNVQMVAALSHRVVVLHNGRKIADGTMEEISKLPPVREAYLGTGGGLRRPKRSRDERTS